MRQLMRASRGEDEVTAAEHFARLGAAYDQSAFAGPGPEWVSMRELDLVSEAVSHLPSGAAVLDAGAGNGRFSEPLVERHGLRVTALDAVPEMLRTVQRRVPSADTVLARLGEPLPFRTASFDAVVSIRVLKWVPAWEEGIRELARLLVPGGTIVVEITNRRSLARFGYSGAPISLCTLAEMRAVGRSVGIEWTSAVAGTHLPHPVWSRVRGPIALRTGCAVEAGLNAVLGTAGARSILMVGTKHEDTRAQEARTRVRSHL